MPTSITVSLPSHLNNCLYLTCTANRGIKLLRKLYIQMRCLKDTDTTLATGYHRVVTPVLCEMVEW